MKPTARNISRYINGKLDKTSLNNISVSLPKLTKQTLEALRNNYNFKVVRVEGFMGYVHFERSKEVRADE